MTTLELAYRYDSTYFISIMVHDGVNLSRSEDDWCVYMVWTSDIKGITCKNY